MAASDGTALEVVRLYNFYHYSYIKYMKMKNTHYVVDAGMHLWRRNIAVKLSESSQKA